MSAISPELVPLDAPTLVEASAGTGKTHTITTYFVRAILERGLTPEQILVVTYTKAATAELRVRSRKRILQAIALLDGRPEEPDALREVVAKTVERLGRRETEARLRAALGQMDQASISTIHGFCQRLLQDYPLLFGIDFDFEVAEDVASLYSELAVDFWATDLYDKPDWLLHALDADKVGIDYLAKLANVAMMPGIEILGPESREAGEEAVSRWLASRRDAGELWIAHREAICEVLLTDAGLNRQSYKRESLKKTWIRELDDLFTEPGFRSLPSFFSNLAQGRMKMKQGFEEPVHPFFEACAHLCDADQALEPSLRDAVFAFKQRFIDFARSRARKRQKETAVLTFDDLLTTVYASLDPSSPITSSSERDLIVQSISNAYPLALVDEFQDTDSIQYGIFHAIYGEGSAVYVGDPKQAIYAFRGADVFSYIGAAADVGERRHTLNTNRRSDPGLVDAVNTLFSSREPPFMLDEIEFEGAVPHEKKNRSNFDPSMEVLFLERDQLEGPLAEAVAPIVASEIGHLLDSGVQIGERPLEAGDVAVLCRSNNQATEVTKALRALDIPASLDGDASVLNTAVASDLRAVLEATLMPGDSPAVRRALLTPLLDVSPYSLATREDEVWSEWAPRFRDWNEIWHSQGVLRFLEDMLRSTEAETRIASQPTARRDLTDLLHIEELLLRGERERRRDPIALMQWFRRLNEGTPDEGAVAYEDLQQRPDAQSGAVRVSTIHKSKGLEYGVVYCPFTWNDASLWSFEKVAVKFHDEHRNIKIDLGSDDRGVHLEISKREAFSEALRLLYVAVTRAKYSCTLFWGRPSKMGSSALGYLLHGQLAPGALEEEQMRADIDALTAASSGTIGCRPPHHERVARLEHESPSATLTARARTRRFNHAARIASFTSLTGHDEKTPGPRGAMTPTDPKSVLFADLPGGVRTGLLLHAILEHVDFQELDGDESQLLIEQHLRGFGFDTSLGPSVQRDLRSVCATPVTNEPDAPRLIDLSRDRQLRELAFTLCVDQPNLEDLAELLRQYGAPAATPRYHERLAQVSSPTLQRFLRGYIDLMFEWQGRWYVADYKSNTLPSYEPEAVGEAVQRDHYVLQAQLYTAAAHRYLKQRVRDYDPEAHWGGALFLFLRGMHGPERAGLSVFFDRQPAELLEAVDRWLGGGDGSR
jgi:exodeoxyribonuclease V beta subunit